MHCFVVYKKESNYFIFNKEQSSQISNVLKLKINSELMCIYNQVFYKCKLIEENKNLKAKIILKKNINNEKKYKSILFVSNTTKNKIEFIIQKATELGVYEINIVNTLRSKFQINKNKINHKIKRWKTIALEVTEQSHRNYIPNIQYFNNIENINFKNYEKYNKIVLDAKNSKKLKKEEIINQNCIFFIGPEGGWEEKELLILKQNKFNTYNLGKRILRMETACITVLSIMNYIQGE